MTRAGNGARDSRAAARRPRDLAGWARAVFPVFEWLPGYRRSTFAADLAAGLTVGAVLIPQGMAYALVAGLPPVAGLYAAVFPILAYALLGLSLIHI